MKQNYEKLNDEIRKRFLALKEENPDALKNRLTLSWSNWGFGMETLEDSAARLNRAGISWIELHGNHYGPDLGYEPKDTLRTLSNYGIQVAGICGMFSNDNDLSSNRGIQRQEAVDYIRRELAFASEVGASYMLVVPASVGRPVAHDESEFQRSVATLSLVADEFTQYNIRCAIEPIRADETTLVHTIAEVKAYIAAVNSPGVAHINGDVYHMQSSERHIGEAIVDAGEALTNLHMADSNRTALGEGSMDLDTIIMALYVIGFNRSGRFVTPEPLGAGADPYPAMHGQPDQEALEHMVQQSAIYFREREEAVLAM